MPFRTQNLLIPRGYAPGFYRPLKQALDPFKFAMRKG
jgi:hypothetical protein